MDRLTYVTEEGNVLFSPDGKDAVTITDISQMGDTEYLEHIAERLANREVAAMFCERKYNEMCRELKAYKDTGLTPTEIMDGKMLTGWIPVTERLPEDGEEVLVTDRFGERRIAYHSREGWHLALTGSLYVHSPRAWMPLPKSFNHEN